MSSKPAPKFYALRMSVLFLLIAALMVLPCSVCFAQDQVAETVADAIDGAAAQPEPDADAFLSFDFGSQSALDGFAANDGGFGIVFAGNVKFQSAGDPDWPDPLLADYATADYLTVTGLDNGMYRMAVIAQNVVAAMVPGRDFSISANGTKVIEGEFEPHVFFSNDGLFYGMQFEDVPGTEWWERYVAPVAPWRVFQAESDGSIRLDFEDCRLFALVAAKADEVSEAEFEAFLTSVQARRKDYFYANSFKLEPGEPEREMTSTSAERNRGYAVFARYWGEDVGYNSVPTKAERITEIALAAAKGERLPATVSIRALEDLSDVTLSVSDLTDTEGKFIPANKVDVKGVRLKLRRGGETFEGAEKEGKVFYIAPDVLQDQPSLDIPAETTKRWWLTINVPEDAAPGNYEGTVTIAAAGKEDFSLPVVLQVYPFSLAETDVSIGLWYEDPSQMGYNTALVGGMASAEPAPGTYARVSVRTDRNNRRIEAYRVKMLESDIKCVKEHGFNGLALPLPRITSVSVIGEVEMDFSLLDAYIPLLEKYGINTVHAGQSHLLGLGRQIVTLGTSTGPIEEFSELHATAFKNAYRALVDYYAKTKVTMLAYVVDEPRERNINPWNRNMEGTLYYLRLVNEMGSWPSTVTTMRDIQHGISYMPILSEEDVVQPHPSVQNSASVRYARRAGKPLRYFNGSGLHRYPYGFYIYAQDPEGYWQWHYQFWTLSSNPVWEEVLGYAVYPSAQGALPTPRLERAAAGICDYRYAITLEGYILKGFASGNAAAARAAARGQSLLDDIKRGCTDWVLDDEWKATGVPDKKLVEWREKIVEAILAIHSALE